MWDWGVWCLRRTQHFSRGAEASTDAPHVASQGTNLQTAGSVVRPLSAFGRGALIPALSNRERETRGEQHRAALEIESIRWPDVCQKLLGAHSDRFDWLADELRCESSEGNRVVAISGVARGEGRTTLALCLAERLAKLHTKVLLVDADFARPSIARQLCIDVAPGWENVLAGEQSAWDVMIDAVEDRLSLLLLGAAIGEEQIAASGYRIAATLSEMAEHYDVVLVDAGPMGAAFEVSRWLLEPGAEVHGIILTHDARRGKPHQLAAGCLQLRTPGDGN